MSELSKYADLMLRKVLVTSEVTKQTFPGTDMALIGSLARYLAGIVIPNKNEFSLSSDADLAVCFPFDIYPFTEFTLEDLLRAKMKNRRVTMGGEKGQVQFAAVSALNKPMPRWALKEIKMYGKKI